MAFLANEDVAGSLWLFTAAPSFGVEAKLDTTVTIPAATITNKMTTYIDDLLFDLLMQIL